ncbi:MAG: GtrA family protein, partial [Ottowia sp.]|nr:GtrA family protein [Ottowia sp.]
MRLALLYSLFAAIATVANIGAQDICVRLWPWTAGSVVTSMAFGTLVGLLVKYVLDKKWIFRFR